MGFFQQPVTKTPHYLLQIRRGSCMFPHQSRFTASMTYRKLNLDRDKIDQCRNLAERIVAPIERYVERHSSTSIEASVLRMMGVENAHHQKSCANLIVDKLPKEQLRRGAAWWFAKAFVNSGIDANTLARKIAAGEIKFSDIPEIPAEKIKNAATKLAKAGIAKIDEAKKRRNLMLLKLPEGSPPLKCISLDAGDIHKTCAQAADAVGDGADIVAMTSAASEPHYENAQKNFRAMRKTLDDSAEKAGRYIRLAGSSQGLFMPDIAAMAAAERVDMLLNDPLCGILFHDINMKRAFVDQHFSRMLCARAGIVVTTGRGCHSATDAYRNAHHVFAHQFLNEQFAQRAGLVPELLGFGHAFDIDPAIEDGFLYELAQAQMMREIFPRSPIKYMPPSNSASDSAAQNDIRNAMFNVCAIITEQTIQILGNTTDNANYIFNAARHIGDEILFVPNGKTMRRAHTVLENAHKFLKKIEAAGLLKALAQGMFAEANRDENGGTGIEGVFQKDRNYFNPVLDILKGTDFACTEEIVIPVAAASKEHSPREKVPAQTPQQQETVPPAKGKKRRRRGRRGGRRHRKPVARS